MIPKAGRCYGQPSKTVKGVNQGGAVSPTVFNIVLDSVLRSVPIEVCSPQESQHSHVVL